MKGIHQTGPVFSRTQFGRGCPVIRVFVSSTHHPGRADDDERGTYWCSMGPRPNGASSLTLPGESPHSSLGAFARVSDPHPLSSMLCLQPCRVFVYTHPPQGQTIDICKHTTYTNAAAFPVLWVFNLPPFVAHFREACSHLSVEGRPRADFCKMSASLPIF